MFVVSTSGTAYLKATRRHATDAPNGVDIIITTSVLVTVMTNTRRSLQTTSLCPSVRPSTHIRDLRVLNSQTSLR